MSNRAAYEKVALEKYEEIKRKSKSSATTNKLESINQVCMTLYKKGIMPRIPLVIQNLNQTGISISKQSIYNKLPEGNPYRELIDTWLECAAHAKTNTIKYENNEYNLSTRQDILDENDLRKIDDPSIRYRVNVLLGEIRGLRNQLNLSKEISRLPEVSISCRDEGLALYTDNSLNLTQYEIETLINFSRGGHSIEFTDDGAIRSKFNIKKGDVLSPPGLLSAIEKIIKNYTNPAAHNITRK